jgi:hypothetical protein
MPGLLTTAAALAAAVVTGCGGAKPLLHAGWQRGFNVNAVTVEGYARPAADRSLRALRATGTTSAVFVVTWYMARPTASAPVPDPTRTASDASLLHAMATARRLGMSLALKPHVDVVGGSFRGVIQPVSVAAWFAAYEAMIDHYAALAARGRARTFVVGTELTSMQRYGDRFRRVIAGARARFGGRLTYAAHLVAGAQAVPFWDALDAIGIDAYMPLATPRDPSPPVKRLVSAWTPYRNAVERLHRRWRRPVLFTEIGYRAVSATAVSPSFCQGRPDNAAQARAYEAAFRAWGHVPWFAGIDWWEWRVDGTDDAQFGVLGRPAEAVVRRFNRCG